MLLSAPLSWLLPWKHGARSAVTVGWIFLAISILAGSTFNGFAKVLSGSLSPFSLLFLSEILTGFFVLFSFGLLPTLRAIVNLPSKTFVLLTGIGVLSGVAGPFLWFLGLEHTTAVNATLFGKGEMIFLIMLAIWMLKERWTSAHAAAICTIVLGFLMVILRGFQDGIDLQTGDVMILLAALSYASGSVCFRKFLGHIEPHIALFFRSSVAIVTFLTVSPFLRNNLGSELAAFPIILIPTIIGFSFVSRFLNSFCFYQAIERLPVATISIVGALDVVGGTVFAHVYVGEPVYWYHALGGGLILLGTVLLHVLGLHANERHGERHLKQRLAH